MQREEEVFLRKCCCSRIFCFNLINDKIFIGKDIGRIAIIFFFIIIIYERFRSNTSESDTKCNITLKHEIMGWQWHQFSHFKWLLCGSRSSLGIINIHIQKSTLTICMFFVSICFAWETLEKCIRLSKGILWRFSSIAPEKKTKRSSKSPTFTY